MTLCFDRAQLAGGHLVPEENSLLVDPKWAVDDRAVAIQKIKDGSESILLLVRGSGPNREQIRPVLSAQDQTAHLVDWIQ